MSTLFKTLYVDNYRGFDKTFIPLTDVNFLVGENSTGKTSILKLLKLISSEEFWRNMDFNIDDVQLGYFHEIVNQFSENKKSFSIGMEDFKYHSQEANNYTLMEFTNKNNVPHLHKLVITLNDYTILIKYNKATASYKIWKNESTKGYTEWIASIPESDKGLTYTGKIIIPSYHWHRAGIIQYTIFQITEKLPKQKSKANKYFPFWYTRDIIWLAPIRAKPQRIYDSFKQSFSSEGEHAPVILRNIMSNKKDSENIIAAIEKFGKSSSLFDKIEVKNLDRYAGAPFEIHMLYDDVPVRITNVGYGISQSIPLIVQLLTTKGSIFSIQQPEVHLHPRAQAAFGELIFENVLSNHNNFIIETHSDYTINRFRYCMHKKKNQETPQTQILFFQRKKNGTTVTALPISRNGQYPDELPKEFGDFFVDEELKMLEF